MTKKSSAGRVWGSSRSLAANTEDSIKKRLFVRSPTEKSQVLPLCFGKRVQRSSNGIFKQMTGRMFEKK